MASNSIVRTADLCALLNDTELEELLRRNYVLDPRDFAGSGPPPGHRLERARKETMNLMQNYHKLQEALYDFRGGYCIMCHLPPERRHLQRKHAHSCQGTGVRMVRDIPGMLLYPKFLQEKKVLMKLIDEVLLSPEHNLRDDGNGKNCVPPSVADLLGSIFDLGLRNAALQVSAPDETTALDSQSLNDEASLHVPLGCDAVLVIALQDEDLCLLPGASEGSNYRTCFRLRSQSAYSHDPPKDEPEPLYATKNSEVTGHSSGMAAILLRAGDVIIFTGPAQRAWKGIAKVMPGSWPEWEHEWPCWGERTTESEIETHKGCVKGTHLDLIIS